MGLKRFIRNLRRSGQADHYYLKEDRKLAKYDIGDYTIGGGNVRVYSRIPDRKLTIGKFSLIGGNTIFMLAMDHRIDTVSAYPFDMLYDESGSRYKVVTSKGDITVGHDAWIGLDSLVLSGVTIGHGAVVGARSVVTKSVPPYGIAAGNPAKFIRYRFDEATIAKLLEIAWWDWPIEKIRGAWPMLMSEDISAFIEKYGT